MVPEGVSFLVEGGDSVGPPVTGSDRPLSRDPPETGVGRTRKRTRLGSRPQFLPLTHENLTTE